jgi:hypothetical protein
VPRSAYLEATYAGPDAKAVPAAVPSVDAPLAAPAGTTPFLPVASPQPLAPPTAPGPLHGRARFSKNRRAFQRGFFAGNLLITLEKTGNREISHKNSDGGEARVENNLDKSSA